MKLTELTDTLTRTPVVPKEIELDKPGGFNVCVLNDPITPAEVVVEALIAAVGLSHAGAMKRMMRAHRNGWHVVATYASSDVAETVADKIMQHARSNTNYDHYRTHPALRKHAGPWPLTADVMEAGGGK